MDEEKHKPKFFTFILVSIIILVLAWSSYFFYIKNLSNKNLTPEELKTVIINTNSFLLPEVQSKGNNQTTLPDELKGLLIPEANITSIVGAKFPGNKDGFIVEMSNIDYPRNSLVNFYIKFGNDVGWKIQKATFNSGFGLISLENSKYKVQVEISPEEKIEDNIYKILIKIINI